jgi:hypothetical protein
MVQDVLGPRLVGRLRALPATSLLLAACGSQPDAAPTPPPHPQPFSQITRASSTTQAELGVVQWWTTHYPDGVMAIGGVDSQSVRVEYVTGPAFSLLRGPHGTFAMVRDGDRVVANTFAGNAEAGRTLELMGRDLAPSSADSASKARPASVAAARLHLATDPPCPNGTLIEKCSSLLQNPNCNGDKLRACEKDSGAYASASDQRDYDCGYGGEEDQPHNMGICHAAEGPVTKAKTAFDNDKCGDCAGTWGVDPQHLLKCPDNGDRINVTSSAPQLPHTSVPVVGQIFSVISGSADTLWQIFGDDPYVNCELHVGD